jgi:hypothetical protein
MKQKGKMGKNEKERERQGSKQTREKVNTHRE